MQLDSSKLRSSLQKKAGEFLQVRAFVVMSFLQTCKTNYAKVFFFMLQLYLKDEGGRNWVKSPMDNNSLKYDSGSVLSVFLQMCTEGRHTKLSDFDDHLNDLSRLVDQTCDKEACSC